jgi:subtilisin-like proprotein convertase family protein
MKTKIAGETGMNTGNGSRQPDNSARHPKWRWLASMLLCLLGLSATVGSARAEIFELSNPAAITIPDEGPAALYPSTITVSGYESKISRVRIYLNNISHTYSGDLDILLVGPQGQKTLLMSDCSNVALNNVDLVFSEGSAPLPDSGPIVSDVYRPTNQGLPIDTFPPGAAESYTTSLAVFNNTSPNGDWKLYVVDDHIGDHGSIAGGWTLQVTVTEFGQATDITVPGAGSIGVASPYPSQINVNQLVGTIRKVTVTMLASHSFPDDMDILLVGPGGESAILMSDAGGNPDMTEVRLTFDDAAANNLPDSAQLVTGVYKPTDFEPGDPFPAPAPPPTGNTNLSVFNGTNPNGIWKLFVVDDATQDTGSILGWHVIFEMEPSTLANISTRLSVQTGNDVLIGGFIVTGTQPKDVIVRALGPSLGVPGQLNDTTLELRDGNGGLIRFNDDWQDNQAAAIIATGIAPSNNREAAIVETLPANNAAYTAIVKGLNNTTGVGLVEVYDLNRTANSKLANISTRGLVQTGNNVMIAGMIVTGGPSQRVIVRAIGPSLSVPGALSDPTLELRDGNGGLIAANDDWVSNQADVIATTVPPTNNKESAIVVTLPSGGASYTAIVQGSNGATGVALVEVFGL